MPEPNGSSGSGSSGGNGGPSSSPTGGSALVSPRSSPMSVPLKRSSRAHDGSSSRGSSLSQSTSLDSLRSSLPRASPRLGPLVVGGSTHASGASSASGGPTSPTPALLREPVRIASVSPSLSSQQQYYQQQQQHPVGHTVASALSTPLGSSAQSQLPPYPWPPRLSPHHGASLAPPTERTRLLLEGGFSLRNDLADPTHLSDHDDEESGLIGKGSMLYGSGLSRNGQSNSIAGSDCASPSPPVDSEGEYGDDNTGTGTILNGGKSSRAYVALILPLTIALCVANSVTWKRMLNRFASVDGSQRNLEFFVNQWTLVLYTLIAGAILAYSPEMRAYPKSRFATMGGLDAVAGVFATVGGALTAGQVQIVVQQANIPITMLLSRLYLKVSSYAWSQYVGAAVIVAGGLLSAFGAGGAGGDEPEAVTARVFWFGPVLILIGIVPGAMSNVYKEANFKTNNLDIYYLTTYVAVWQTLLSFACVPLFTLKYFGGIPLHEMPQNLADGWHCFMGRPLEGYLCDDPFPSTATILLLYVLVNFAFNMALLSMVKHGSALALVIAVAVALPITNLVFTQEWAMGSHDVEELSLYNLLGIALVVMGFLLYSLLPEPQIPAAAVAGAGKDVEGALLEAGAAGAPPGMRMAGAAGAGAATAGGGECANFEHLCREFMLPTGAAGHSLYVTEYLPSVGATYLPHAPAQGERRHSFDFHSSPSIRIVQQARKKRLARAMENKTPSRTP